MKKLTVYAVVAYLIYHAVQLATIVPALMATATLLSQRVPY